MTSTLVCSIDGCKKAAACLCHHCNENVCFKHLGEHQVQINNELLPLTDRLNELKMKLQVKDNPNGTLAMLKAWRDKKYREIDEEYERKVHEFDVKVSEQDAEVSGTITKIEQFINEGEVSYDQVKQLKKDIDMMENQVNQLMKIDERQVSSESISAEPELVNKSILIDRKNYVIKARVFCQGQDLYAMECETPMKQYNGLCPQCRSTHVKLEPNRGFYVSTEDIHERLKIKKKT